MNLRAVALSFVLGLSLVPSAFAADLDPATLAKVNRDREKALQQVEAQFGNKKPHELGNDERRALMKAKSQAEAQVLEQHGVTAKDYARSSSTLSRAEQAEVKSVEERLAAEEKAKEKSARQKAGNAGDAADDEVEVQLGFGDGSPVDLVKDENAEPIVEYGAPETTGTEGAE